MSSKVQLNVELLNLKNTQFITDPDQREHHQRLQSDDDHPDGKLSLMNKL